MKNKHKIYSIIIPLFCLSLPLQAQNIESEMKVPPGAVYAFLGNADENNVIPCFATNKQGVAYYAIQNNVVSIKNNQLIELPAHCHPSSMCWTNNDKLVFFSNDTLFFMEKGCSFRPLLSVKTAKPIIQPIGVNDFAFCVKNDTVLYRYFSSSDSLAAIVSLDQPIEDFIVDQGDCFIAYGNRVIVLSQEKDLIPLLIDEEPISSIAFCGNSSLLFSTPSGLWLVNEKREKELIYNQPILDMMTDNYDRAFFMFQDGTWLLLSPVSAYETEQE